MYFCAIYGWYFYLTWLPTYLLRARGFDLRQAGWLAALRERGGPLTDAALAFLRAHAAPEPFPRAGEALAWLAACVERQADIDAMESEDRAFVDGAGALLALLLVDHLGAGEHVTHDGTHRVRLGARGFFDPFAAIDEALDAERPRAALAGAVRRAEAEAREVLQETT